MELYVRRFMMQLEILSSDCFYNQALEKSSLISCRIAQTKSKNQMP